MAGGVMVQGTHGLSSPVRLTSQFAVFIFGPFGAQSGNFADTGAQQLRQFRVKLALN